MVKAFDQQGRDKDLKAYKLAFPADLEVERVTSWLHSVSGSLRPRLPELLGSPSMVFELWSFESGFVYRLLVPWQHADYIVSQLRSLVPGIHVTPDDQYPRRPWKSAVEVGMRVPTRQLQIGSPPDASASILASMNTLDPGEAIVMQWVVTPARRTHPPVHNEATTHHFNAKQVVRGSVEASKDEVTDRRSKLEEPNMQAVMRVAAHANTKKRAKHLVFNIQRSFNARASAGTSFTKRLATQAQLQKRIDNASAPISYPMLLSLTELASLIAWPLGNPNVAGLPPIVTRHLPPTEVVPRTGRVLGQSNMPGRERAVALDYNEARKHMHILSATGAGKTSLLVNMFRQDIEQGFGAIVIETKGDMFHQAVQSIPPHRRDDVIVFDVNDMGRPVGFNLLDQGDPNIVMDELTSLFEHLYSGNQRGVWTRSVMHFGLQALAFSGNKYTIMDLGPLLSPQTADEVDWRESIIRSLPDERTREWFNRLDNQGITKREQIVQPVMDRIWELSRPKLRSILGQSVSSFKMADVITGNKILLVNLSNVESESGLLMGTLVLNSLWSAVKNNPMTKPNFLYMDEFQNLMRLPLDTAEMLTQARSFGLGMVLANQHMGQLPNDMQEAVKSNARSKVVFQLDGTDARVMSKTFGSSVSEDDLTHLGRYQTISRVAVDGTVSAPFTMVTNPPAKPYGGGEAITAASRERYGRAIGDVEREMMDRRKSGPTPTRGKPRFSAADSW